MCLLRNTKVTFLASMASSLSMFLLVWGSFSTFPNSSNVQAANVFVSALYGEGSHFLAASAIGQSLVKRGHNVTFLISSAYYEHRAKNTQFSNFSYEIFKHPVPDDEVREMFHTMNTLAFVQKDQQFAEMMKLLTGRMVDDCEYLISDKQFVARLEIMDAMVLDISWPCVLMIREILRRDRNSSNYVSMVTISHTPSWSGFIRASGSSFSYAYQPEFTTGLPSRMNFVQRLQNVLISAFINVLAELAFSPPYLKIGKRLGLPPVHFVRGYSDFDLHLTNINFASDFIYPLAPNVIPVGGLTATLTAPLVKVRIIRFRWRILCLYLVLIE